MYDLSFTEVSVPTALSTVHPRLIPAPTRTHDPVTAPPRRLDSLTSLRFFAATAVYL